MFKLFGNKAKQQPIRDFQTEYGHIDNFEIKKAGVQLIPIRNIVGSVGRAAELDSQFCSKNRGWSERHKRIHRIMSQGKPLPPIKLYQVSSENQTEYFIVDGHHRVAAALRMGFEDMNAEVTSLGFAT